MSYKDKYFYIPSVHAIVYVHGEIGGELILGGSNSRFLTDAKTNRLRQLITMKDFELLTPEYIVESRLSTYRFLEKDSTIHEYRLRYFKDKVNLDDVLPNAAETNLVRPIHHILSSKFQHR